MIFDVIQKKFPEAPMLPTMKITFNKDMFNKITVTAAWYER